MSKNINKNKLTDYPLYGNRNNWRNNLTFQRTQARITGEFNILHLHFTFAKYITKTS